MTKNQKSEWWAVLDEGVSELLKQAGETEVQIHWQYKICAN